MSLSFNCSTVRAQFGAHLRGQLPPAEALTLAQHLRRCPACRETLALEQRLKAGAGPRIAAPTGFTAAVLAQPHPRPGRPIQIGAILKTAAAGTAFRAFVDPLLRLDLELHDAGTSLRELVAGPLTALQPQLRAEGLKLCRYLAFPFIYAGSQVCAALSGPTDVH